jgi:hypothetical protein
MRTKMSKALSVFIIVTLLVALSGCGEEQQSNGGKPIRLSPVYSSMITGGIIGGIIGHQSDERDAGIAAGAAIFGVGALLSEIDKANKEAECEDEDDDDEVVFQIRNDNGSEKAVVLKKRGGTYIGPEGERYNRLPAAEQLKQKYGS